MYSKELGAAPTAVPAAGGVRIVPLERKGSSCVQYVQCCMGDRNVVHRRHGWTRGKGGFNFGTQEWVKKPRQHKGIEKKQRKLGRFLEKFFFPLKFAQWVRLIISSV